MSSDAETQLKKWLQSMQQLKLRDLVEEATSSKHAILVFCSTITTIKADECVEHLQPALIQLPSDKDGSKNETLIPTVYALWAVPSLNMPTLITHHAVFERLVTGADLMIPGVHNKIMPDFIKGDIVAVRVNDGHASVAVGIALMSSDEVKASVEGKGRLLTIVHTYTDKIWEMGDKSLPPLLSVENTIVPENAFEIVATEEITQEPVNEVLEEPENVVSAVEMDDLLFRSVLQAVKVQMADVDLSTILPMPASLFFSDYILLSRPRDSTLNIKLSSHKKLSKFFKYLEKTKQLIKCRELQTGELMITDIGKSHADVIDFAPYAVPLFETPKNAETKTQGCSLIVHTELFQPRPNMLAILSTDQTAQLFTSAEVKQALNKYFTEAKLISTKNPRYVVGSEALSKIVIVKNEEPREKVMNAFIAKMQTFYKIELPSSPTTTLITKRGVLKKIVIIVEVRQGRKLVTRIQNLDQFPHITTEALIRDLPKICACSVGEHMVGSTNELVIQGRAVKEAQNYLKTKFGLYDRLIEVQDKAAAKKKKK